MKTLKTLANALATLDIKTLDSLVHCADVDVKLLSDKEKFCVLIYDELSKAINTKDYTLLLDCNYSQSKNVAQNVYKVDYFRLVSNDTKHASMIQFYTRDVNVKSATCNFLLCTSCARTVREAFIAHNFNSRANDTTQVKTTYESVVDTVKTICAILADAESAESAKKRAQSAENAQSVDNTHDAKTRADAKKTRSDASAKKQSAKN